MKLAQKSGGGRRDDGSRGEGQLEELPRIAKSLLEINGEFINNSDESLAALLSARFVIRARRHSGLTQTELAKRLRVGQSRISRIENISTDSELKISTLIRLAEVCGGKLKLEFEPNPT